MRRTWTLLAWFAAWWISAAPALAQTPADPPAPFKLRPAAEPRPALKYRLAPERLALEPGNAAVFYHRAIIMATEKRRSLADQEREKAREGPKARVVPKDELLNRWITGPIAEIPRDQAREYLDAFANALREVELGMGRATCDWGFDRRPDGYSLPIPEIQETRGLARLVSLKARLAILDVKTDAAMHWIEAGLVMGRHVSQGPTLIQALVGVAIDNLMTRCLEELIQAPGTPSLYWALADRPRPFIDLGYAMEGERHNLEFEIPGLLELDKGSWSLDKAKKFSEDLQRKLFSLVGGDSTAGTEGAVPNDMPSAGRRLGIAAMTAKIYPKARKGLVAQGMPESEVEAMPIVQVSVLYCYREHRRLEDDSHKWMNVPYWQSFDRGDRMTGWNTVEEKMSNPLLTMFRMLSPNLGGVRQAVLRGDRQFDALQCVEAIRLHVASHEGKFPATLDAMSDTPVPTDLMTGKPFEYKVDGDSATLSAPVPPGAPNHPSFAVRYVLKLVK